MGVRDGRLDLGRLALCCWLCLTVVGIRAASSEEFSDLPIGYQEITEGEDGMVKVLARCVPAQPLLDELAKRAGVTLEQARPVQAYVSAGTRPRDLQFAQPFDWIGRVADDVCLLAKKGDSNVVTLEMIPALYYDPFLTEEEVIAKYRTEISPQTPAEGIKTGLVIIDGHLIRPPYAIAWEKSGEYDAQITLNGVPWFRVWGVQLGPATVAPDVPPSGQFDNLDDLCYFVSAKLYGRLLKANAGDVTKTLKEANAFIKTQSVAEDCPIENPTKRPVLRTGEGKWEVYPSNFDFSTGRCRILATRIPSLEESVKSRIAELDGSLRRGHMLIGGVGAVSSLSRHPFSPREWKLLADIPSPGCLQRECVLRDSLSQLRSESRTLAANLRSQDYAFSQTISGRIPSLTWEPHG